MLPRKCYVLHARNLGFSFCLYRAVSCLYTTQIKVRVRRTCCMLQTRSPVGQVLCQWGIIYCPDKTPTPNVTWSCNILTLQNHLWSNVTAWLHFLSLSPSRVGFLFFLSNQQALQEYHNLASIHQYPTFSCLSTTWSIKGSLSNSVTTPWLFSQDLGYSLFTLASWFSIDFLGV